MKYDWKDIANRAVWTFAQAALAVLALNAADVTSVQTINAALIAGLAAAVSAVKNIIVQGRGASDSE